MKRLVRAESVCPTPEEQLLDYVRRNLPERARLLARRRPGLLEATLPGPQRPALLVACSEDVVRADTVRALLQLGADPGRAADDEADDGWRALHFAAAAADSAKLRAVLERLPPGAAGVDSPAAGGATALHVLLTYGADDAEARPAGELARCTRALLDAGADVNLGDANNVSPVLWAAKKGLRDVLTVMLEDAAGRPVDLDTHTSRGRTARQLIEERQLYPRLLPPPLPSALEKSTDPAAALFALAARARESAFLAAAVSLDEEAARNIIDSESGQYGGTLLQLCCQEGLSRAAARLLALGADPERTSRYNAHPPVQLAAERGCRPLLALLLDDARVRPPAHLLSFLLTRQTPTTSTCREENQTEQFNYTGCYEELVTRLRRRPGLLDLNTKDERSNTALHYAARYAGPTAERELLTLGASLAARNRFGVMPIEDVDADVLSQHLDDCIEFDADSKKLDKEDFTVTFNYRTLLPPRPVVDPRSDVENGGAAVYKEPRRSAATNNSTEMDVIWHMSRAVEFRHLLKHPVIVSFLFVKWHRLRWLFYANLLLYVAFAVSLATYVFASLPGPSGQAPGPAALRVLALACLWVTFVLLVLRELLQALACCDKYVRNFENYVEVALLAITACILVGQPPGEDARRQLAALAVLLAAFELVLMLGQHPLLSTNVVMLRTVSYNFFKFLLWYSLLIVAFSLSFYLLFAIPHANNDAATADGDGEEGEDMFANPGKSVFKTIVMLTGEFDASDLNFHTYPVLSKLIFVLFVFVIAIILLNLLTGLAVSDTQMIKNDAELVGHVARAEHVRYVEGILLGGAPCARSLRRLCCCLQRETDTRETSAALARRALVFADVEEPRITVYPNRGGQLLPGDGLTKGGGAISGECRGCAPLHLDRETARRTAVIVHARREQLAARAAQEVEGSKRDGGEELRELLRELQAEQDAMGLKLDHLHRKLDAVLGASATYK